MKPQKISILHLNEYHLYIPKNIGYPFYNTKSKRIKVIASFKKTSIRFYATLKKDKKTGDFKMMFSKAKQKKLNLTLGDELEMQLFEDTSKYGVDIPKELEAVLMSDYDAYCIFESFTAGKKRSIIYDVIRYKGSQNKIDKSLIMCENLKRGNHEPLKIFKI